MTKLAAVDAIKSENAENAIAPVMKKKKIVHFIVTGKGGVGKSYIAVQLAQHQKSMGADVKCIDTDPLNPSLRSHKGLKAQYIPIIDEITAKIDESNFDKMMQRLLTEDGTFIVDTGVATYTPLLSYMSENAVLQKLEKKGYEVYFHCVIFGGAVEFTTKGFAEIAEKTQSQNMVVWLNEFNGKLLNKGQTFIESKEFNEHKEQIAGIVVLHRRSSDTFLKDLESMWDKKITYEEALADPSYILMQQSRFEMVRDDIFKQLDFIGS